MQCNAVAFFINLAWRVSCTSEKATGAVAGANINSSVSLAAVDGSRL